MQGQEENTRIELKLQALDNLSDSGYKATGVVVDFTDPFSGYDNIKQCMLGMNRAILWLAKRVGAYLIQNQFQGTSKPVLVYPNSGETYIAETNQWVKSSGAAEDDFVSYIGKWRDAGASLFDGCCRTTPNTIKGITEAIRGKLQGKLS